MQFWKKPSLYNTSDNHIDADVLEWLLDKGSLTQKLIAKSNDNFHVEVLQQKLQGVHLHEQQALAMRENCQAVVREVILYGSEQPWVYARTIIPQSSLEGPLQHLNNLGDKPLGEELFKDPTMTRGELEVAQLAGNELPKKLNHISQPVWGRRSVFHLSQKPLLVCEFFLPALFEL